MRPMAGSPRILIDRQPPTGARSYAKSPIAVYRRCACSGVKARRNTSTAKRQAAKLCWRFGPLTPSARSANLIESEGTKNGFTAPDKEPPTNQKHHLTGKPHTGSNPVSSATESVAACRMTTGGPVSPLQDREDRRGRLPADDGRGRVLAGRARRHRSGKHAPGDG
jgi:hypothetical protein